MLETSHNFRPPGLLVTVWQLLSQNVHLLMVLRYARTGFSVNNTLNSNPYFCFSQRSLCFVGVFLTSAVYLLPKDVKMHKSKLPASFRLGIFLPPTCLSFFNVKTCKLSAVLSSLCNPNSFSLEHWKVQFYLLSPLLWHKCTQMCTHTCKTILLRLTTACIDTLGRSSH